MNYHIEVKSGMGIGRWQRIASFENECDKDDCLYWLAYKYSDCEFRKEDEEE